MYTSGIRCAVRRGVLTAMVIALPACGATDRTVGDEIGTVSQAGTEASSGISNAKLQVRTLMNSCGANQAQDFFEIVNNGSRPVALSDIKLRFWIYETSASDLITAINYPGCIINAGNPSCVYPVPASKASIKSERFSPATGSDATHQANREVTVSFKDSRTIPAGGKLSNLQVALRLPNGATFTPGAAEWYSPCQIGTTGSAYAEDHHFSLYHKDNLVYASGVNAPPSRAPKGVRQMSGYIKPAFAAAPIVGPVPDATIIKLSLSLPVRQPTGQPKLSDLAAQVSDPASPQFRKYLTQQQFTDTYAPTPADYQAIIDWAKAVGLTVNQTVSTRMVVGVSGPASVVNRALYVNLAYHQRPDGTLFYAPDREPSIDISSPLVDVGALNDYVAVRPLQAVPPATTNSFDPNTILDNGYGLGDGKYGFGEGECVGLYSGDGFSLDDMNWVMNNRTVYTTHPALARPTFRAVILDPNNFVAGQPAAIMCSDGSKCGVKPTCPAASPACCMRPDPNNPGNLILESTCNAACQPSDGTATTGSACASELHKGGPTEIAVDIQMAMALAPGLSEIVVYEGGTTDQALAAMASDPAQCHQLSTSWGLGTEPRTVDLLNQLAVQGQAFSTGSGDDGTVPGQPWIARLAEVTSVGATILTGTAQATNPSAFDYTSEVPWRQSGSWFADGNGNNNDATDLPKYQQGINLSFCGGATGKYCIGSTGHRDVPDLAMLGANMQFREGGVLGSVAGTSVSSPLWASFLAVANSYGKKHGVEPIGFPNGQLYAIGKTSGKPVDLYQSCFHDLATGSVMEYNPPCSQEHDCGPAAPVTPANPLGVRTATAAWSAVAGYDLATGLGSPTPKLIEALTTGLSGITILDVAAGWSHTCALKNDGTVACWGADDYGQLGVGYQNGLPNPIPRDVVGLSGIASVAAGMQHTCAVEALPSGRVWCWGRNYCGILGDGTTTNRSVPVQVQGLPLPAIAVAGGMAHTCAILSDQSVWCWGCNYSYQLGIPNAPDTAVAVQVSSLANVSAISAGQFHTCVVVDGAPWCWGGANKTGEIGDGTTTSLPAPTRAATSITIDASNYVSSIGAGAAYTCIVVHHSSSQDELYCWGDATHGNLGDSGTVPGSGTKFSFSAVPVAVQPIDTNPLTVWSASSPNGALSTGSSFACVLRSADHSATECWGNLIGIGPNQPRTEIASLGNVAIAKVTVGMAHACVLLSSGELKCWGVNGWGQIGDGSSTTDWPAPHTVHFF
jgi:alpha-tubulin suppressor-like RCC1 family protein